ncbi:MAG: biotin--[acetyl-CoA-carboxylase] ligase [Gemmatimonadales bacterium]|nr:biotin--[acetyl-CoA-carboxylase] ligase [Gemmatimonadales bacterium]
MLVVISRHEELPSTMDAAHQAAAEGALHGTTIQADRQVAGRGTRGRAWESAPGGLWLSVVARPARTDALEALSLRVGLALARALEASCPGLPTLGMKWPNDLLLEGGKVAGVLCEARWSGDTCQWITIGIGVNVSNDVPAGLGARTIESAVRPVQVDELAEPVALAVATAASDAGPLTPAELAEFGVRDALRGQRAIAPIEGTIDGITRRGALRVRRGDGRIATVLGGLMVAH